MIHNLLDSKINHILQLSLDESILDSVQSIIQNMISSGESLQNDSNSQQLSYLQSCGFGGLWRFAQPFAMVGREKPENVELFIDCLEAMVETALPPDNDSSFSSSTCTAAGEPSSTTPIMNSSSLSSQTTMTTMSQHQQSNQGVSSTTASAITRNRNSHSNLSTTNSFLHFSSTTNLIGPGGSMSSISMGSIHSPNDLDLFDINDGALGTSGSFRRNSRIRRNSSPRLAKE